MRLKKMFVALGILFPVLSAHGGSLPTPEEVQGVINVCSAGRSVEVKGELDLSIDKLFSGEFKGEGRINDLGGIIAEINDEKLKLEAFSMYQNCILPLILETYSDIRGSEKKGENDVSNGPNITLIGDNNNIEKINIGDKKFEFGTVNGDIKF